MKPALAPIVGLFATTLAAATLVAATAWAQSVSKPAADAGPPKPALPEPAGTLSAYKFTDSKIFPGTTRDYWVYTPPQYDGKSPACVMVFCDGGVVKGRDQYWRAPALFDQLIAEGAMPITVGVFVEPGRIAPPREGMYPRYNRSYEYDEISDLHARFLAEEFLPEIKKTYNLSDDPNCRGIVGISTGANAAFVAAWLRPDLFSRVLTTIGTFVNQREADTLPSLIRKHEPQPLRVFLYDGTKDGEGPGGSWFEGNRAMQMALEWSGYEVDHLWSEGFGHDTKPMNEAMPRVLRWLWRGYPDKVQAGVKSRAPIARIVSPEAPWELAAQGLGAAAGVAVGPAGELYFADASSGRIHRVAPNGAADVFIERSGGASALAFGPDGRLYAAQPKRKRVVAYDAAGKESVVATGIAATDLAIDRFAHVYVAEPARKQVWLLGPGGKKTAFPAGVAVPERIALHADQQFLYVADPNERLVSSFQIQLDGSLAHGQPWCRLHLPPNATGGAGAGAMTVDDRGNLYVASKLGLQVCDEMGRPIGVIRNPGGQPIGGATFAGADLGTLYLTVGDRVYRRKAGVRGVRTTGEPPKLPRPRT